MSGLTKSRRVVKIRKFLGASILIRLLLITLFLSYWSLRIMRISGFTPSLVYQLAHDPGSALIEMQGRTNILILGVGGGEHEGAALTDTMLIVSINTSDGKISLLSLPRDIWSDMLRDKINTAYYYGEEKKSGGGLTLAQVTVEDITGLKIPYSIRLDFQAFVEIINVFGGIDINVPVAFTDPLYPIPGKEKETCPGDPTNGCVYQEVHFDAGMQHMDGERALVYTRSRHAKGTQGSDFSRNTRQQEVLIALKNKIIRLKEWVSVPKIELLIDMYSQMIDTNMTLGEMAAVIRLYLRTDESAFHKVSIDNELHQAPEHQFEGRYVLIPKESWEVLKETISKTLSTH